MVLDQIQSISMEYIEINLWEMRQSPCDLLPHLLNAAVTDLKSAKQTTAEEKFTGLFINSKTTTRTMSGWHV